MTDSAGETATDTILVVVNPFSLSLVEIEKAEIEWEKQRIKVNGKVSLPVGKSHYEVSAIGMVTMDVSTLGRVVSQVVIFEKKGDDGKKWEYKDGTSAGAVTEYKIDWKGAKFDYKQDISIKANHLGQDTTSLEIDRKEVTEALTITVGDVVITIDETGTVSVTPDTLEIDVDDDGEVEVELPFALTPDMVLLITQAGSPDIEVLVGDYYTDTMGKFKIEANFDPGAENGDLRPATFDLGIRLGLVGFSGDFQITDGDWKELKTKEWKYKR